MTPGSIATAAGVINRYKARWRAWARTAHGWRILSPPSGRVSDFATVSANGYDYATPRGSEMSTNGDLRLEAAEGLSGILPGGIPKDRSTRRVIEPAERIAEVLFGLIMVLTFTGSLSVAEAGRDDVRAMLIGALGCNLAWGVIDGLFYLMGCLAEKGRNLAAYKAVLNATTAGRGTRRDSGRAAAARRVAAQTRGARRPARARAADCRRRRIAHGSTARTGSAAWAVFLLVFIATFPVAIPFMFIDSAPIAMRVSNAVAVAMLFAAGFAYGKVIHRSPRRDRRRNGIHRGRDRDVHDRARRLTVRGAALTLHLRWVRVGAPERPRRHPADA